MHIRPTCFITHTATERSITFDAGSETVDVYNVLTEEFMHQGVSGEVSIAISPDEAVSLVLAPAGGVISYQGNRMLIDGVTVDYRQNQLAWNAKPRIQALAVLNPEVEQGDTIEIFGTATDLETKDPVFSWYVTGGVLLGDEETVQWIAPDTIQSYEVQLVVTDEALQTDTAYLVLRVVEEVNIPPVIEKLNINNTYTAPGGTLAVECVASDENGDNLTYAWSSTSGTFEGSGSNVLWRAGQDNGIFTISVEVTDEADASSTAQRQVLVYEFTDRSAQVVAHYPFTGNADDQSGNEHHGDVQGPKLTADRNDNSGSAYFFDGVNDHISVANDDQLNFNEGITISTWIRPGNLPDRESFIISHGSWQNRWKLSIIPDRRVRWTLKTATGAIRDIDSQTTVEEDKWYHVAATYDGAIFLLYVNGCLESFANLTGAVNNTSYDLEIGQMLPDDQGYNFRGDIDDISIYNQALLPDSIASLGEKSTSSTKIPAADFGLSVYPNPAKDILTIEIDQNGIRQGAADMIIYNSLGEIIYSRNNIALDVAHQVQMLGWVPGVYYLLIKQNSSISTIPFVIIQ